APAPQLAVIRVRDPDVTACCCDAEPAAPDLERRAHRVALRVDHRDRPSVDVRYPELAADPGRPEGIRADVDRGDDGRTRGVEPHDLAALARDPECIR